uniref:Uncharacterized protein n=1 Tax=Acrobeloides nanus TaxID=290746 RepID=A0A914DL08_9BILA
MKASQFIIWFLVLSIFTRLCYSWGIDDSNDEDRRREREEQERLDRYVTCFSCCMSMCEAGGGTNCSGYCDGVCR